MKKAKPNAHFDDLLDFLAHAGERGLMPAATAQALTVAVRSVFSVLDDAERSSLPLDDLDGVIRRFTNKRARSVNPASLQEYVRRVRRAVDLYQKWKSDPANFTVQTRATNTSRTRGRVDSPSADAAGPSHGRDDVDSMGPAVAVPVSTVSGQGYQTAFPVRPGHVVVVSNIPLDLSPNEAERLAQFIRLLAPA